MDTTVLRFPASILTQSDSIQHAIEKKFERRQKTVINDETVIERWIGPQKRSRGVVFVDDLHLPSPDKYDCCSSHEILRSWLSHGGWYNKKDGNFLRVRDLHLFATVKDSQKSALPSSRLLRFFAPVQLWSPSEKDLIKIFSSCCGVVEPKDLGSPSGALTVQDVRSRTIAATIAFFSGARGVTQHTTGPAPLRDLKLRCIGSALTGLCLLPSFAAATSSATAGVHRASTVVKAWAHECVRTVCDRFAQEYRDGLNALLLDIGKQYFGEEMMKACFATEDGEGVKIPSSLCFGNGLRVGSVESAALAIADEEYYDEILIGPRLVNSVRNEISSFNKQVELSKLGGRGKSSLARGASADLTGGAPSLFPEDVLHLALPTLDISVFTSALRHLLRICRALQLSLSRIASHAVAAAHIVLLGEFGLGRRSLAVLAAHLLEHLVVLPVRPAKADSSNADRAGLLTFTGWREVLGAAMEAAGLRNRSTTIIITDDTLRAGDNDGGRKKERILEDLERIMSSSPIPDVWSQEQQNAIVENIRPIARDSGEKVSSQDAVMDFFERRVRKNLHVIVCLNETAGDKYGSSNVSSDLSLIATRFPGILRNCVVDRFSPWPRDALHFIADHKVGPALSAATKYLPASQSFRGAISVVDRSFLDSEIDEDGIYTLVDTVLSDEEPVIQGPEGKLLPLDVGLDESPLSSQDCPEEESLFKPRLRKVVSTNISKNS